MVVDVTSRAIYGSGCDIEREMKDADVTSSAPIGSSTPATTAVLDRGQMPTLGRDQMPRPAQSGYLSRPRLDASPAETGCPPGGDQMPLPGPRPAMATASGWAGRHSRAPATTIPRPPNRGKESSIGQHRQNNPRYRGVLLVIWARRLFSWLFRVCRQG